MLTSCKASPRNWAVKASLGSTSQHAAQLCMRHQQHTCLMQHTLNNKHYMGVPHQHLAPARLHKQPHNHTTHMPTDLVSDVRVHQQQETSAAGEATWAQGSQPLPNLRTPHPQCTHHPNSSTTRSGSHLVMLQTPAAAVAAAAAAAGAGAA
jgi:hypothetical protein